MTRNYIQKVVYSIPVLPIIDSKGSVIGSNQPDLRLGKDYDVEGSAEYIKPDLVQYFRTNLYTQLSQFHQGAVGGITDRTGYNVSGICIAGTGRDSYATSSGWTTPIASITLDGTATVSDGIYLRQQWSFPSWINKSFIGTHRDKFLSSGMIMQFDGSEVGPSIPLLGTTGVYSMISDANGTILLDDLTTDTVNCLVRSTTFIMDTTWETDEGAVPAAETWKRFDLQPTTSSQCIKFITAKRMGTDLFMLQNITLEGISTVSAGRTLAYIPSGGIQMVAVTPSYAYRANYKVNGIFKAPNGTGVTSANGFIEVTNGGIFPPNIYSSQTDFTFSNSDYEFSWKSTFLHPSTQNITKLISPAAVILEKYSDMLQSTGTLPALENPTTTDQAVQERFAVPYGCVETELYSDSIKNLFKTRLTDIDLLAIRSALEGYKDSFVATVLATPLFNGKNTLYKLVNDATKVCLVERSHGRATWYAGGLAMINGSITNDHRVLSWTPVDKDGVRYPLYSGLNESGLLYNKALTKIFYSKYGMVYNITNISPTGTPHGYNTHVRWLVDSHTINNAFGLTNSRPSPLSYGGIVDSRIGIVSFSGGPKAIHADSGLQYWGSVTNDGHLTSDGKIDIQTLLGTYAGWTLSTQGTSGLGGSTGSSNAPYNNGSCAAGFTKTTNVTEDSQGTLTGFPAINTIGNKLIAVHCQVNWVVTLTGGSGEVECAPGVDKTYYETDGFTSATITVGGHVVNLQGNGRGKINQTSGLSSARTYGRENFNISTGPIRISTHTDAAPTIEDSEMSSAWECCTGTFRSYTTSRGFTWTASLICIPIYEGSSAAYPTGGTTFDTIAGNGPAEDEAFSKNLQSKMLFSSGMLPYEADSQFAIAAPSQVDGYFNDTTMIPQVLATPINFDNVSLWLGPRSANTSYRTAKLDLVALHNGKFCFKHVDDNYTNSVQQDHTNHFCLAPGSTKQLQHLASPISRIISVRALQGLPAIVTISGDSITAGSKVGYDALIIYDTVNEVPAVMYIQVTNFITACYPDFDYGDPTYPILYWAGQDRYEAQTKVRPPLSLSNSVSIGAYGPLPDQIGWIVKPDLTTTQVYIQSAQVLASGGFTATQPGTYTISPDQDDLPRNRFNLTAVRLTVSKTTLTTTTINGDSVVITNAQGVEWKPQLAEYLTKPSTVNEMLVCDIHGYSWDDSAFWTTSDNISWTLTLPAGWKPPYGIDNYTVVGHLGGEYVYAVTKPITINV